jgi:hypothetical protein
MDDGRFDPGIGEALGVLANLGCKLVCRLAHIGSTYSEVGGSGKPGAVQYAQSRPHEPRAAKSEAFLAAE